MDFKAPTGEEIVGTFDKVTGSCRVNWNEDGTTPAEFEHSGDTKMFWDSSVTQSNAGTTLWLDDAGSTWPDHHLIPEDAEPVTDETIDAMDKEQKVGALLDALVAADAATTALGITSRLSWGALADTRQTFEALKEKAIALKKRDLARVPA